MAKSRFLGPTASYDTLNAAEAGVPRGHAVR